MMTKTIYSDSYRALISQLKAARRHRHLTQEQTGKPCGKGRTWLNKIETCEVRLDVLDFTRLCRALDLEPGRVIRQLARDIK